MKNASPVVVFVDGSVLGDEDAHTGPEVARGKAGIGVQQRAQGCVESQGGALEGLVGLQGVGGAHRAGKALLRHAQHLPGCKGRQVGAGVGGLQRRVPRNGNLFC